LFFLETGRGVYKNNRWAPPAPSFKKAICEEIVGHIFGTRQGGLIIFEFSPENNHPF